MRLPNGLPLPEAFGMFVPVIQEVGSVDRIDPSDFAGLDSFCAIIGDGGHRDVELLDFVGRDAIQAVVLPVGTLNDSPHRQVPSAESLLTAGADLVVFPGDQLCGGPSCGVIVGRRREIKTMTQSRSWSSLSASQAVMAMLWATLESAGGDRRIPIQVLLDASEENLRDRAERMATRLQGSDSIKSCQVSGHDALVTANGRWRFLSRQVRARHASKSSKTWQQNLLERVPAIATTVHDDELCVDLRWVAAADDPKVSAALVGSDTHVSASAEDRD